MSINDFSADLHMHSTCSDGALSPDELVRLANERHINVISITDHDNMRAPEQLIEAYNSALFPSQLPFSIAGTCGLGDTAGQVSIIPGVEMSIDGIHGLHLLGYGFTKGTKLHAAINQLSLSRVSRARQMISMLADMGFPMDFSSVRNLTCGSVGRCHIAEMMVSLGYVNSIQEAFALYIGDGKPAYVPGDRLNMVTALHLMRESGFVPVLAHPCELCLDEHHLRPVVASWADNGLEGIEVYHPSANRAYTPLLHIAADMHLLVTGGSDFHFFPKSPGSSDGGIPSAHCIQPGEMSSAWNSCREDVTALLNRISAAKCEYECNL